MEGKGGWAPAYSVMCVETEAQREERLIEKVSWYMVYALVYGASCLRSGVRLYPSTRFSPNSPGSETLYFGHE